MVFSLEPLVDNQRITLEETYRRVIPESEEIRISTGYFYLSGFDLVSRHFERLLDPEELEKAPMRILMGRQTDRFTVDEVQEGQSIREHFKRELVEDVEELNYAQVERLDRLRDFIAQGLIDVRVRIPEEGYYHAKGACFRLKTENAIEAEDEDNRAAVTIVGSSNFTASGQRRNVELNMTSQDPYKAEAFEKWFDNQWANAEEFSEEIVKVIETSGKYQSWKEEQSDDEEDIGTYLEPFEMYKLLAYDELNGNVSIRDSPLFYFQRIGYESAKEKLSQYNGCIISDSVGLGKSFIGSELLHDYRKVGDRCLLIVPANLTDQWIDLLQDATDEYGNPYFNLEVDGKHIDVMSITKFQNLTYQEVQDLKDSFDVVLIDEAHRFRNYGRWQPDPSSEEDYKGTRRHANLRQLRGKTMVMLTATPINNSATDLRNLIGLFTSAEELRNKASLNYGAFDQYIDLSKERKRIASGKQEASAKEKQELEEQLQSYSEEISEILNEVMVLRTRKHVKDQIREAEDFEMSFTPPILSKEEYKLPPAYGPVYQMLPDVMDALHLPHITVRNPSAGQTLKALYKLNLLKRLESSTYAFVQSLETLHESEHMLLGFLEKLPEDEDIDTLRAFNSEEGASSLDDFVEGADAVEDITQVLEEFGFDTEVVRASDDEPTDGLANATVGEVKQYIREDLTLLAFFLSQFIGDVAQDADHVSDLAVQTRQWLTEHRAGMLPQVPEDVEHPALYPDADLTEVGDATQDFYEAVFRLREFRDPKIELLGEVLAEYDKKVIVFTQYRATADYVHRALLNNPNAPVTEGNSTVVKGGDENKQDVIKRFAPEASGYQELIAESDEEELQFVIATDTLSEGVNLQDVDVVVNYDLPWNPMRIVQRVGRIDRIGSTAKKYVHNFYPDGDIEAAISLLERLQAKINDIALIVGKENNILDPEENKVLSEAGVDPSKTIGELEVEEIERSLRKSRAVDDINELDDTSVNPLLRNAGSDESEAFERYLLKTTLNEEYGLGQDDFEFAEEYFELQPEDRDFLYTNVTEIDAGPQPGVFGLAHLWFDEEEAPLGRVKRAFFYKPFGREVRERHVSTLNIDPESKGKPIRKAEEQEGILNERSVIETLVDERLESIQESQVEGAYYQGGELSKEQETLLSYCMHLESTYAEDTLDRDEFDTIGDWVTDLKNRLSEVGLKNTDEDRILRETFRKSEKYESLAEWPPEEFLNSLDAFLVEYVDASAEYQDTLVSQSDVNARLICWGVIN